MTTRSKDTSLHYTLQYPATKHISPSNSTDTPGTAPDVPSAPSRSAPAKPQTSKQNSAPAPTPTPKSSPLRPNNERRCRFPSSGRCKKRHHRIPPCRHLPPEKFAISHEDDALPPHWGYNSPASGTQFSRRRPAPPTNGTTAPKGTTGNGETAHFHQKKKMLPLIRAKTFPQPQPGPQPGGTFLAGLHTAVLPGLTAPCRGGPDCGSAPAPAPRAAGAPHKGCRRELTTTAADLAIAGRRFFLLLPLPLLRPSCSSATADLHTHFVFCFLFVCTLHVNGSLCSVGVDEETGPDETERPPLIHGPFRERTHSIMASLNLDTPSQGWNIFCIFCTSPSHSAGLSAACTHSHHLCSSRKIRSRHDLYCISICIGYT